MSASSKADGSYPSVIRRVQKRPNQTGRDGLFVHQTGRDGLFAICVTTLQAAAAGDRNRTS